MNQVEVETYKPFGSIEQKTGQLWFHACPAKYRLYLGVRNAGKSWALMWEIFKFAVKYPGIRILIGRKELKEAKLTIREEFLKAFPETSPICLNWNRTDNIYSFATNPPSQVIFMGVEDIDKIKMRLGAFAIDEASEITKETFLTLQGNTGVIGMPNCGILASNHVTPEHWLYRMFEVEFKNDPDYEVIRIGKDDNPHIPKDYYTKLAKAYPPSWRKALIEGEYGFLGKGMPVTWNYNPDIHKRILEFNPKVDVIRGWDFGRRHPACVWLQIFQGPIVNVLDEKLGTDIIFEDFLKEIIIHSQQMFGQSVNYRDYCGHDVIFHTDKSLKSNYEIMRGFPYDLNPKWRVSDPEERAVVLTHLMDIDDRGYTQFYHHPRCKLLEEAFLGGYYRDEKGKIFKDGYYEHPVDGLGCAVYNEVSLQKQLYGEDQGYDYSPVKETMKVFRSLTGRKKKQNYVG